MARSQCRALVRDIDDVIGQDSQFYDLWLFRGSHNRFPQDTRTYAQQYFRTKKIVVLQA